MTTCSTETKYSFIMYGDNLHKINVRETNGMDVVTVNVHNMTVKEARVLITNIIALNREPFELDVIHGYTHGTAIKEMLCNEYRHENHRIVSMRSDVWNPGISHMMLSAAY